MRKVLLISAGLISLAGCSTIQEQFTDYPKQVSEMQLSFATAATAAKAYATRPLCGTPNVTICHSPDTVLKIDAYAQTAETAIEAARVAETQDSINAAQTALTAYRTIVNAP